MIAIRNDIDPEVVITRHGLELVSRDVSTSLDMTIEGDGNHGLARVIREWELMGSAVRQLPDRDGQRRGSGEASEFQIRG